MIIWEIVESCATEKKKRNEYGKNKRVVKIKMLNKQPENWKKWEHKQHRERERGQGT